MGGEAFKRRLVYNVAVAVITLYHCQKVLVLANVLKCKACLKQNLNACALLRMCSLVINPFSCDYMKMELD